MDLFLIDRLDLRDNVVQILKGHVDQVPRRQWIRAPKDYVDKILICHVNLILIGHGDPVHFCHVDQGF